MNEIYVKEDFCMINQKVQAIILAAGKSTRFNTGRTKLLEPLCGQEMILYPTKLLSSMKIDTSVVVGFKQDEVSSVIKEHHGESIRFIIQDKQLGTGHALICSQPSWHKDHILVLNGDVPLISNKLIQNLYESHIATDAAISFVTSHVIEANSYGRVIKDDSGIRIVEASEFNGEIDETCVINAGIYLIKKDFLEKYINKLNTQNSASEFFITDLVQIASESNRQVNPMSAPFDLIRGINTLKELWTAEHIKRSELIEHWMDQGVRFSKAHTIHIELNVTMEAGTVIGQAVQLIGKTHIGANCSIAPFSVIENSTLKNNVSVKSHSIITDSTIEDNAQIGPFAHIHTQSFVDKNTIIGNFVEMKKSTIGKQCKAKHHLYLGNAQIGANVIIGAGMTTCNYDGRKKHATIIKDGAFIGGNNSLVAPVTIGEKAYTAAGSVITEDVPDNSLAIARSRQTNKAEYAHKLRPTEKEDDRKENNNDCSAIDSFLAAQKTDSDITNL